MVEFSVVQQPSGTGPWPASALVWRTCVREIGFADPRIDLPEGAARMDGEAAYAHLLEVICGLHSPMVGETEVLHQFKVFAAALPPEYSWLREIGQRLQADAREIRSRYLIGLGSRSYGSAVRRYLGDVPRVAIVGAGMLATEILPFVTRPGRVVDLWGRRLAVDLTGPGVTYRPLDVAPLPPIEGPCAIVIAAPAPSTVIRRLTGSYRDPLVMIDLRAEGVQDPPPPVAPIVTLADVFAGVEEAARVTDARVARARDEIRCHARAFAMRAKLNPSGWHDLCA